MTDILMPALSPTMEEGNLAKWHVKVGDKVESGQVIAEIETDTATMEVEAVDEGVVSEIVVPEGSEGVKVNAVIARLKDEGGAAGRPSPAPPPSPVVAAPAPAPPPAAPAPAATPAPKAESSRPSGDRVFASPLAKRLAQQKGVDLKAAGIPTQEDYVEARPPRPGAALRPSGSVPWRGRRKGLDS